MSEQKMLIVEDDDAMAIALKDGFRYEQFEVRHVEDGHKGLQEVRSWRPDVVVLDVMLPRISGLDVLKTLRSEGDRTPILMLTARSQEIDKVLGLRLGADDYVTKPFSFLELNARVEALLRRAAPPVRPCSSVSIGSLTIDFKRFEATRDGQPLSLSPREYKILEYLIAHRGEVMPREQLLTAVWGYHGSSFTRTVDMHIAKLRKKIERIASEPEHILTVHGVGYKFVDHSK